MMTIKVKKSTHHSNSIGGQELSGSEDGEVGNVGEHVDPRDQRQGDVDRSGQVLVWTLNISSCNYLLDSIIIYLTRALSSSVTKLR